MLLGLMPILLAAGTVALIIAAVFAGYKVLYPEEETTDETVR